MPLAAPSSVEGPPDAGSDDGAEAEGWREESFLDI